MLIGSTLEQVCVRGDFEGVGDTQAVRLVTSRAGLPRQKAVCGKQGDE